MSELMKVIGNRIKNIRNGKKLSQEKLSLTANINRSYLGQLERGEKSATIDLLDKIAYALDVPLEELISQIKLPCQHKDNVTLSLLIDKLSTLSYEEQKVILNLLDVLFTFKKTK